MCFSCGCFRCGVVVVESEDGRKNTGPEVAASGAVLQLAAWWW